MSVALNPGAAQDLAEAYRLYRREGRHALAKRRAAEFEPAVRLLGEVPEVGPPTYSGRRACPMTGFLHSIIDGAGPSHLHVLDVRHQSRDPSRRERRG